MLHKGEDLDLVLPLIDLRVFGFNHISMYVVQINAIILKTNLVWNNDRIQIDESTIL